MNRCSARRMHLRQRELATVRMEVMLRGLLSVMRSAHRGLQTDAPRLNQREHFLRGEPLSRRNAGVQRSNIASRSERCRERLALSLYPLPFMSKGVRGRNGCRQQRGRCQQVTVAEVDFLAAYASGLYILRVGPLPLVRPPFSFCLAPICCRIVRILPTRLWRQRRCRLLHAPK